MSRSADPGHFFQTTESLAAGEARSAKSRNKLGDPIDVKAKLLAVHAWGQNAIIVAGGDGQARLVDLKTRKVSRTYTGAFAPLTCLAVIDGDDPILFAGCWDKSIYSWYLTTGKPHLKIAAHSDFLKSLATATIKGRRVLLSGSTDASIMIWDAQAGTKLHQIKAHTRGVLSLAVHEEIVFSADSVRDIRQWRLGDNALQEITTAPIVVHETSVNSIRIVQDDTDDIELWTASSDKTAKRVVQRNDKWEADTTFEHPDFVKDVLPLDADGRYVATACRDGDVRIWNTSSGQLECIFEGHYDEVSALASADSGRTLVSVSLDGTVRTWKIDEASMRETMLARSRPQMVEEEAQQPSAGSKAAMTAEEEAELAELMDSD